MWKPHSWVAARLHRALFFWFGATIAGSGLVFVLVLSLGHPQHGPWFSKPERVENFAARRFAQVWQDEAARSTLARESAETFGIALELRSAEGATLSRHPESVRGRCDPPRHHLSVRSGRGDLLGHVLVCAEAHWLWRLPASLLGALLAGALVLWAATGALSRRLAFPIRQVASVAADLGEGKLESRVPQRACPRRHGVGGEAQVLADAINTMADRLQKQLLDQKQLLAAVSHELRTPLGHMRVLLDTATEQAVDPALVAQLEREVVEMDSLVGQLLAHSRLEFEALHPKTLQGLDLAIDALQRQGLPSDLAHSDGNVGFDGDPTLLARALANLIDNAVRHGGGATSVRVVGERERVRFEVRDRGPGFKGDPEQLFAALTGGASTRSDTGLGLGLALVQRIAIAHGGRLWSEQDEEGETVVGFSVQRTA